ncbi:MAG: 50S ribosomal protein L11 methyltransferase [Hydrococcus sp. Prado102]|jgi:protein arginine N-methyltransferase 1|nr:50S ribosomal protein L11 methyltransferase [Hydrococcus sp. Prado102]
MTVDLNLIRNYKLEEVWLPFSESILEWEQDFHSLMLNDEIRMVAYQNAIREVVKPDMVVLDLGTGTGILGLWALQAGAKQLYAIEVNPDMIPVAIATFEQGGMKGKYEIFEGLSYDINLPEPVDLIISEILGNIGDNEDCVPILNDAYKRFLRTGGKMLPSLVSIYLVPVSSLQAHQQVRSQNCKVINAKYSLEKLLQARSLASPFNHYYDAIIPRKCYLSQPQIARRLNMDGNDDPVYQAQLTFVVEENGVFTGFKGSFIAQLSESVALDISGDDINTRTTSDSWKHCYLPVETPVEVESGDEIDLLFSRSYPIHRDSPFRQCYAWSGTIKRRGNLIHAFKQSMGD